MHTPEVLVLHLVPAHLTAGTSNLSTALCRLYTVSHSFDATNLWDLCNITIANCSFMGTRTIFDTLVTMIFLFYLNLGDLLHRLELAR